MRGISAPFVHIFVCVRSIIVKVLCLNATLPPYDQVSYKETNEYAARIRLSILQVYYLFLNYLNIAIKNLYLGQFIPSLKAGVFLHPDRNDPDTRSRIEVEKRKVQFTSFVSTLNIIDKLRGES